MDAIDLFGEISAEEELCINERRKTFQRRLDDELAQMSEDPSKRTIAQNRKMFLVKRSPSFQEPQIIASLFDLNECKAVYEAVLSGTIQWKSTRHSAFPTVDIAIRHTPFDYLNGKVKDRVIPKLAAFYGFKQSDLDFRDLFLVKYEINGQKGLSMHTDGCLFSFNILISPPDQFEGGGTYFAATDKTVHIQQGDCLFHSANMMHRGVDITRGHRYILVGFVDTVDTIANDKYAAAAKRQHASV